MSKQRTLLKEIIIPNLPELFASKAARDFALANPHAFNVEHLVELSLARVGEYEFVDGNGYDFDDNSESKTTTVNEKTLSLTVMGVENKIGSMRIVAYNPIKESVDYFFLTQQQLRAYASRASGKNTSHKERLQARWNAPRDHYNQFEQFRVNSFEELAKKPGFIMKKK